MRIFLRTERLVLRWFTPEDIDLLIELDSDPAVVRFINGGQPVPADVVREVMLPRIMSYYERFGPYGFWAAHEQATGAFIGWFILRPVHDQLTVLELGYRLRQAAWGHGYATEGSLALLRKGFIELGAERITANTLAINEPSRHVMEKVGLQLDYTYTYTGAPGTWHVGMPAVEYGMNRAEWEAANQVH